MVNALNTAVSADVDGIAVCLVDQTAFNEPVEKALQAGIPVVSYNADSKGNKRLCYIGQDLFLSGKGLGQRIIELVPEGEVVGFIATPGQLNIQPQNLTAFFPGKHVKKRALRNISSITCTSSSTSKGDGKPSSSLIQCRANSTPF